MSARWPAPRDEDHLADEGAVAMMLVAAIAIVGMALVVAATTVASVLAAGGRAQDAADAAALAAVAVTRAQPRVVATRVAARNGATLVACRCEPGAARVSVQVGVASPLARLLGVDAVVATADAGLVVPRGAGGGP